MTPPVIVGLTGPIGCGKSTVARWLAATGRAVIDADAVARDVSAPGTPAHDAILVAFGDAVRRPDGTARPGGARPDRVRRPGCSFARLEAIVHPRVRPAIRARLEDARRDGRARRRHRGHQARRGRPGRAVRRGRGSSTANRPSSSGDSRVAGWPPTTPAAASMRSAASASGWRPRARVTLSTSGSVADVAARVDALWAERVAGVSRSA